MKKKTKIAAGIILALAVLAGGFWVYAYKTKKVLVDYPYQSAEFKITDLGVSFKYPAEWGTASIQKGRVEAGIANYVVFSDFIAGAPTVTYASQDFKAGRSGTTAEIWTVKKWPPAKTCSDIARTLTISSSDCRDLDAKNGQRVFIYKTTKFGSDTVEGLYFTGNPNFPVLGAEANYSSDRDYDLIKSLMTSIDSIR